MAKTFKTTGSYLDVRLAILRTDYDPNKHGETIAFWAGDEPLFQNQQGDVDQDNQASVSLFGFDDPHDGMAVSFYCGGKQEAILYGEDTDALEDDVAKLLAKHFIADVKIAAAVANVISVAWGFGGEYSEVDDESLSNLEDFTWTGDDGSDELSMDDNSYAGGVVITSVMCSDVPAEVRSDGSTELDLGDGELSDFAGDRFICVLKPDFKSKIKAAKAG